MEWGTQETGVYGSVRILSSLSYIRSPEQPRKLQQAPVLTSSELERHHIVTISSSSHLESLLILTLTESHHFVSVPIVNSHAQLVFSTAQGRKEFNIHLILFPIHPLNSATCSERVPCELYNLDPSWDPVWDQVTLSLQPPFT